MATLTINVGGAVAQVTGDDGKTAALILDHIAASGGPVDGTNEEKLLFWLRMLTDQSRTYANDWRRQQLANQAAIDAGLDSRGWN